MATMNLEIVQLSQTFLDMWYPVCFSIPWEMDVRGLWSRQVVCWGSNWPRCGKDVLSGFFTWRRVCINLHAHDIPLLKLVFNLYIPVVLASFQSLKSGSMSKFFCSTLHHDLGFRC
jgi:hypothetical protein